MSSNELSVRQGRKQRASRFAAITFAAATCFAAQGQVQVVRPPVAQVWLDVATFSGLGMPAGLPSGMPNASSGTGAPTAMSVLGGLLGDRLGGAVGAGSGGATAPASNAGSGSNRFGQTQGMATGRWLDVTLTTRQNPQLSDAQHNVPAGFLSPALRLQAPKETRGAVPEPGDERTTEPEYERPKGKLTLYWGCGENVRPGQPRVLDMATASPADLARFFQARRATQRGTHSASGRPVWPSAVDSRMLPAQASLVGEHAFAGSGVPDGFRFQLPSAQDLMPALSLRQREASGATQLEWQALPTARAYFIAAMGSRGEGDMVLWTSSEQPETGFGLLDYQTNAAVDRWLKEQVLLAPQTTRCDVPRGAFGSEGAMLRMIAYGSELNLAHPPRPLNPLTPWEPIWAAKVRVKSVSMALLGQDMAEGAERPVAPAPAPEPEKKPGVKDLLRGILGR